MRFIGYVLAIRQKASFAISVESITNHEVRPCPLVYELRGTRRNSTFSPRLEKVERHSISMDKPKPDFKSRVKLFENGPTSTVSSVNTAPRETSKDDGLQQQAVVAPRQAFTSPKRHQPGSVKIPTRNNSAARIGTTTQPSQNSSSPVVLSPTKKVLTMNGTVSKRYYDIKARRNMLRGKSNSGVVRKVSIPAEDKSSGESGDQMSVNMTQVKDGAVSALIQDKSPVSPTHRVWSESQQQEERHQILERRVGVEDGGVGWFSPPEEETSLSSSEHASLAKQHSGPASYSPDLREPITRTPAKYESKVARLRNIRSRSPYFIAHHDKELKRNLEAASVILNEEKESSVGSGESFSTRSSLSQEEIKNVAERALTLAGMQQGSSNRTTLKKDSPHHQKLSENRPWKPTSQPRKATISYNPGPSLSKMYPVSRHGRLQALVPPLSSSTTSNSEATQAQTSSSDEPAEFPGRLTRSERYAMIKAKTSHPFKRGAGGALASDEESMDISGTTEDSAVPYQPRHFKDSPIVGYSKHFLAMSQRTGAEGSQSPYDDSSTITSESPLVTGSESQTISSADEKPVGRPFYKEQGKLKPGSRYSRTALPPPFSVPIRSPSSRPRDLNSHQSTMSSSTGDNTESIGGSDSTNRAMNRSFMSRSQRAKALKEALQRQEKPTKQNLEQHNDNSAKLPNGDPITISDIRTDSEEASPKRSSAVPAVRSSRVSSSSGGYEPGKDGFRGSRNKSEFFDRLCKPAMVPDKTSESETDSGDDAFFETPSRCPNQQESISGSYGTSTSSSVDARTQRPERLGSPDILPTVDTTSASTTLEGVGILDMESSVDNSSKLSLRKQPGPFQRRCGTPPPPPPPVSSYYFDRKKDDSYDTSDEIEQTRSPTEPGPSPAKSSLTQTSNNDAMKWWNKNYSQLVERSDPVSVTTNDVQVPRRGIDPVQVQTNSHEDDDEDVFSGLEEDRKDEKTVSSEESDEIPSPRQTPMGESSAVTHGKSRSPMKPNLAPLKPISQPAPAQTSPASPRSPLSPRSNWQRVASPRASVHNSGTTASPGTPAQQPSSSFASPTSSSKASKGWPHNRVETIEEEGTQGGESREKSNEPGAPELEDLLDDSVMVASMSISKAIGKDGQPQQSQQADHIALLNFGYSIFESISSFCKLPSTFFFRWYSSCFQTSLLLRN